MFQHFLSSITPDRFCTGFASLRTGFARLLHGVCMEYFSQGRAIIRLRPSDDRCQNLETKSDCTLYSRHSNCVRSSCITGERDSNSLRVRWPLPCRMRMRSRGSSLFRKEQHCSRRTAARTVSDRYLLAIQTYFWHLYSNTHVLLREVPKVREFAWGARSTCVLLGGIAMDTFRAATVLMSQQVHPKNKALKDHFRHRAM